MYGKEERCFTHSIPPAKRSRGQPLEACVLPVYTLARCRAGLPLRGRTLGFLGSWSDLLRDRASTSPCESVPFMNVTLFNWFSLFDPYAEKCVSRSVTSDSLQPSQAPLSMGFSRQEYWSGLPFPSPWDLPDPGIEPRSPALQGDSFPSEPPKKPLYEKKADQHPTPTPYLHLCSPCYPHTTLQRTQVVGTAWALSSPSPGSPAALRHPSGGTNQAWRLKHYFPPPP